MKSALLLAAIVFSAVQYFDLLGGELTGHPYVHDGDSLSLSGIRIRIAYIDAPELDQPCSFPSGAEWPCGVEAKEMLIRLIGDDEVSCTPVDVDRYRRTVATCSVRGRDIGAEMTRQGMALAYYHYSKIYLGEEEIARREGRGIWGSSFKAPWDYRREKAGR
jgi:endonuclease YncB( thermonuclease family)